MTAITPMGNKKKTGILRGLFWTVICLTVLAIIGGIAWDYLQGSVAVADQLETAKPWLLVWRMLIFAGLIAIWPRLIVWFAVRYEWNEEHTDYVTSQRWRVAAWLIVIELILVQGVVMRFAEVFI